MVDDAEFARQRVAGQHPCMLKALKKWNKFPFEISSDTAKDVIKDALHRNQLFVCDYESLKLSSDMIKPGCILPTPIALFHVDPVVKELMPVGIYFRSNNLFVTPKDKPILWFLAKLHVQCADNHYQQFHNHLPLTHWILEPMALAAKYALPDNHPIGRLLRPHFRGIFQINWLSRVILANKGGIIDEVMASGRIGAFALSNTAYQTWNFKEKSFLNDIKNRGVEDPKVR